ncbi:MAG: recombinase family protein [Clostridia bacterium]|nr:recombinase family protein [Clostridia bacterium]
MLHSLSAQVSYYSKLIQNHCGWEYAGVYADEALTGTKDNRENFQRLLSDCRNGKGDMIITKSVSRFARNTLTLLETVRELKSLGVDVYFEEQNIHSATSDGELILTILASYAQEESLSASENQKWRVRQQFQNGKPWRGFMMGYRYDGEKYVIVPEEAEVVRSIFRDYLDGKGVAAIMKRLNEEGILTQQGFTWHQSAVSRILRNYAYTGNLLLQTKFRENHLTKRTLVNHGELPQYHAENTHEPIIDIGTYNLVQLEMARRAEHFAKPQTKNEYPFTGLITCARCGKHYRRKVTKTGPVWICATYNTLGKKACPSKSIPEPTLMVLSAEMDDFSKITAITADKDNTLIFSLENGETIVKRWKDRSRSESWTPEMRAAVGKKTKERSKQNGNS